MQKFTDSSGAEWKIELNAGAILDIKKASEGKFNLFDIDSQVNGKPLSQVVLNDPAEFSELLWLLVEDQAKTKQVETKAFFKSLCGAQMFAAQAAFQREWQDFFREFQREDVATALAAQLTGHNLQIAKLQAKLQDPRVNQAMGLEVDQALKVLWDDPLNKILNPTSGDSSDLSESPAGSVEPGANST